jgi:phage tail P2-like protein
MSSLLPHNSTPLERALEAATADETPVPLRSIYDPATCPVHLLPYLAWECSVDRWDENWSESVKRAAISASFYIHEHKGTLGAIRRVVEPLGYLIDVVEWWQKVPEGVPGTFALKVGVLDKGITDEMYSTLTDLIDDAKPLSRHLIGLDISLETTGQFFIGASCYDGDEITIDPPQQRDIEVTGNIWRGGRIHTIDTVEIYS